MYSRELNGEVLTLAASGWTYDRTFVLYDHQTESLWYHFPGANGLRCIGGTYADEFLREVRSTKTRWHSWHFDHPQTLYWASWLDPGGSDLIAP